MSKRHSSHSRYKVNRTTGKSYYYSFVNDKVVEDHTTHNILSVFNFNIKIINLCHTSAIMDFVLAFSLLMR